MPTAKKTTKKTVVKKTTEKKAAVKKQVGPELSAVDKKAAALNSAQVVPASKQKYFEAVGRRKTSTARVRLFTQGKKGIVINEKLYTDYFPISSLQKTIEEPVEKLKCQEKFAFTIIVKGGGLTGQAEACRHGISRALILLNPYFRKRLKKTGLLTRDPRMRERKKPGLKRARRAPQWSKR